MFDMIKLKTRSNLKKLGSFNPTKEKKELSIAFLRKKAGTDETDPSYYSNQLIEAANKKKHDILIDFYNSFYDSNVSGEEEKETIVKKIARKTRDLDSLIILGTFLYSDGENLYSSNPILYRGQQLEYFRQRLDHEVHQIAEEKALTIQNGNQEAIFNWKGWRIGFENCKDHGELKRYISDHGLEPVDLQILLAYNCCGPGGPSREAIAVKDQGYIAMYDGILSNEEGSYMFKIEKKDPFSYKEIKSHFNKEISFKIKKD